MACYPDRRDNAGVCDVNASDLGVVLSTVAELLATDKLDVNIAREYDLEDAGEAQRAVMEDSFYGKLVAFRSIRNSIGCPVVA